MWAMLLQTQQHVVSVGGCTANQKFVWHTTVVSNDGEVSEATLQ
jgi:hypothetical protein